MAAPTMHDAEKKLDYLCATNKIEYLEQLKLIKSLGFRVFKNHNDKHKIRPNEDALGEFFGGAFK